MNDKGGKAMNGKYGESGSLQGKKPSVDANLANKVRAAFDAYVYSQYKKKDAEYAKELKDLVYCDKFCKDAAIWFDGFLPKGKDFDGAFRYAAINSYLFGFLEVSEKMTSSDEWMGRIHGMALEGDANDPSHLFFLGLACLYGIGVDVDSGKGEEYVTMAAQADLPEAMEKLAAIYQDGDGLAKDDGKAAEWKGRLALHWESVYNESKSMESGGELVVALSRSAYAWEGIKEFERARSDYEKLLSLSESLYEGSGDEWYREVMIDCYRFLGLVNGEEDNPAAAKGYFQKYVELQRALTYETGKAENRCGLWWGYNKLGDILKSEGDLAAAREYYQKGLELAGSLVGNSENMEPRGYIFASYRYLGQLCESEGDMNAAREYYLKSLESNESLARESDEIEPKIDLAWTYERLGYISEKEEDFHKAEEWYGKCLPLKEFLDEKQGTEDSRWEVMRICFKLGDASGSLDKYGEAKKWYGRAVPILDTLKKEDIRVRRTTALIYNRLGNVAKSVGNLAEAREWYEKSLPFRESVARESKSENDWIHLAAVLYDLGYMDESHPNLDFLRRCETICLELAQKYPQNQQYEHDVNLVRNTIKRVVNGT